MLPKDLLDDLEQGDRTGEHLEKKENPQENFAELMRQAHAQSPQNAGIGGFQSYLGGVQNLQGPLGLQGLIAGSGIGQQIIPRNNTGSGGIMQW